MSLSLICATPYRGVVLLTPRTKSNQFTVEQARLLFFDIILYSTIAGLCIIIHVYISSMSLLTILDLQANLCISSHGIVFTEEVHPAWLG